MAKNNAMKKPKNSSLNERILWMLANVLRNKMDASKYKTVILGLIFLKYVSDCFTTYRAKLVADGNGFEDDPDEYTAARIFYVPEEAQWSRIAAKAFTEEIGIVLDNAMRAIEENNPRLKGVLPKEYASGDFRAVPLGKCIEIFSNIELGDMEAERDLLGNSYEYCLSRFAAMEGKNAGEFYTSRCLVKLLAALLRPLSGRIYDPCCGSGGMFAQSVKFIQDHGGKLSNLSVYGQESNPVTRRLALMNLALRGIEANLGEYAEDTFVEDFHKQELFDYIMANPPFNMTWDPERLRDDPRWTYGIPTANNANYIWLQHMLSHLKPTGRMGVILSNGSLTSQTGGEGDIRRKLIEADLVECIIALPPQLFYSTQIPACIWVLSKNKPQKGKTLFIDARNMGCMVNRTRRELTEEDIAKLAEIFAAYIAGTLENVQGLCAVVGIEDIAAHDFALTPGIYAGVAEQKDDDEPFNDKMERLVMSLADLFAESGRLQKEIEKSLKEIGYAM